jgi:hypothetical protein
MTSHFPFHSSIDIQYQDSALSATNDIPEQDKARSCHVVTVDCREFRNHMSMASVLDLIINDHSVWSGKLEVKSKAIPVTGRGGL